MKRLALIIFSLTALSAPLALTSGTAMAVNVFSNCGQSSANGSPDVCNDASSQKSSNKQNPIINIIKQAINVISFIIGIGAVIGIVVSGIRIMVAGGDSQAVATARTALIYSLVGLAVAAVAQAIVAFVLGNAGK